MLAIGTDFEEWLGIKATLQSLNEIEDVLRGSKWIFSWGFLTPSPSRIPKRVYIWRKEIQSSL